MGSTVKEFDALDAPNAQHVPAEQSRDGHASQGEKRTASGSGGGDWLVNVAGDVVVPMTTAEIVDGLRTGALSERSLVWRLGMQDWVLLGDVPQLRLASGTARTSALPPASARVAHAPAEVPSEPLRRRNTLPHGFPVARDPASVRQPNGFGLSSPLVTPGSALRSAPEPTTSEGDDALAVYDRPAASLAFSDSVRAEWHGESQLVTQAAPPPSAPTSAARGLTPVPVAARLSHNPRSAFPNSLIPTTSDLDNPASSQPPHRADLSEVLAPDFRAAKASTKRVVLWAAFGSALVASAFTLWLVRTRAPEAPTTSLAAQSVAARPVLAPPAASPIVEPPASSAVSAVALPAKAVVPRVPKAATRPKPAPPVEPAVAATASDADSPDNPYGPGPANEPSEPRPAATPGSDAPSDSKPATATATESAPAADPPSPP